MFLRLVKQNFIIERQTDASIVDISFKLDKQIGF